MKKQRTYSILSVVMIFALFMAIAAPVAYGIAEAAGATWQCKYCGIRYHTGNGKAPKVRDNCSWGPNAGNPHVVERI